MGDSEKGVEKNDGIAVKVGEHVVEDGASELAMKAIGVEALGTSLGVALVIGMEADNPGALPKDNEILLPEVTVFGSAPENTVNVHDLPDAETPVADVHNLPDAPPVNVNDLPDAPPVDVHDLPDAPPESKSSGTRDGGQQEGSDGEESGGSEEGGEEGEGGCFTGDTKVWMANGGTKNIVAVTVGDLVLTRDDKSGTDGVGTVSRVFTHHVTEILDLHLDDGEVIRTTAVHRFASAIGKFQSARSLERGSKILTLAAPPAEVTTKEAQVQPAVVYNLTVDRFHTYFVGQAALWVHNVKKADEDAEP